MIPTEEMVRVAAIAVRQARNGCITPPENGTEYDEQLARAALSAALAAMWQPIETHPVAQEPVAWQWVVDGTVFSTTVDKRVAKQWRDSGYNVEPCYRGTPPATSAGLGADEIARITCEKWNIEKD